MSLPVFVRKTEGNSVNTTLTLNIQSSGTDRVFVLGLAYKSNSVLAPISVVFNGTENFTLERTAADGGDAQCFLYYLTAPSEVTADVVITMPSTVRMVGYVALFNGVHQTEPFTANTNEVQGTNDSPTVDVSSAADEMCIDILVQVSAGPDTATATHTEICNGAATGGGTDCRGAAQYVVGQTTRTMNWSMSGSDNWNIIAGALQEPTGGVTVSPTPASAISTALIGAILLGSTLVSPSPAVVIGARVNPTVTLSSTSVAPSPVSVISSTVNPKVVKGSLLLSPSPVEAVGAVVDPTVIVSGEGELVTPDPVTAVSTTLNPTVVLGNSSVAPSPVNAVSSTVNPIVKLGSTTIAPDPASVIVVTVDPNVIKGSIAIIPGAASSVGATVNPTVIKGSLALSPSPVSSVGMVVDPAVILGSNFFTANPASAIGAVVDPTVIITTPVPVKLITGVMSESLHIRGIMSKEFSAIRCLDFDGNYDYVVTPYGSGIDPSISPHTFEMWVKVKIPNATEILFSSGQSGNDRMFISTYDGKWTIGIQASGWWEGGITSITTDWTYIILIMDGSDALLYINLDYDHKKSYTSYILNHNIDIGRHPTSPGSNDFNGKIGATRIYNKALNATERQNNFNGKITQDGLVAEWLMREQQGNIIHDTSINSNHGTIHGADWYEEKFNTPLKGIMSNSSEITGIMTAEYI